MLLLLTSPPAHSECRWGRERGRSIPFAALTALRRNVGCWGKSGSHFGRGSLMIERPHSVDQKVGQHPHHGRRAAKDHGYTHCDTQDWPSIGDVCYLCHVFLAMRRWRSSRALHCICGCNYGEGSTRWRRLRDWPAQRLLWHSRSAGISLNVRDSLCFVFYCGSKATTCNNLGAKEIKDGCRHKKRTPSRVCAWGCLEFVASLTLLGWAAGVGG